MANAMIERLVQEHYERLLAKGFSEYQALDELAKATDTMANTAAALKAIAANVENEATPEALKRRVTKARTSDELLRKSTMVVPGAGVVPLGRSSHVARISAAADLRDAREEAARLRKLADELKGPRDQADLALKHARSATGANPRDLALRQAQLEEAQHDWAAANRRAADAEARARKIEDAGDAALSAELEEAAKEAEREAAVAEQAMREARTAWVRARETHAPDAEALRQAWEEKSRLAQQASRKATEARFRHATHKPTAVNAGQSL